MDTPTPSIGFIGLGRMGTAMAGNILEKGFKLTVYDLGKSKIDSLVERGAHRGSSPRDVASRADIVFTSLMDDNTELSVTGGPDGIIAGLKKDGVHICLSTILPGTARLLAEMHKKTGTYYIAGPVLGRPDAAEKRELKTFLSGNPEIIENCKTLIESYTNFSMNLGEDPGAANSMKICANYIAATQIEMMSEIYTFAEKSGLNPDIILIALKMTFADPTLQMYAEKIRQRDFENVGFDMVAGLKDISLFQQAFSDVQVIPGIINICKNKHISAIANGMKDLDWCATYEVTRMEAGLNETKEK